MKLTKKQKEAIEIIREGMITWCPGDKPSRGNKTASIKTIRSLIKKGICEAVNVHPYGQYPVYGAILKKREAATLPDSFQIFGTNSTHSN